MASVRFEFKGIDEVRKLLSVPRRIVITTHHKPDGDAMGSSLGLLHLLRRKGHQANVVIPSDQPDFLLWMQGQEFVTDFEKDPGKGKALLNDAEVLFCLDYNAPHRTEKMAGAIVETKAVKILIDHHLNPEKFCDYTFSFPGSCATSELIYYFIARLGDKELIDKNSAECLYAGIMTDTASFRFSTMKPETHRIIADLMEAGVENFRVHELVYDNFSEDRFRFVGYVLREKMIVLPEFNTAIIAISREELNRFNHRTGDTEGIVNLPLGIRNIRMSALFVERKDLIKISFRSKDEFSVKELASAHFEGGGHKNASGGKSSESLDKTVERFKALLPKYRQQLTS